MHVNSAIIWNGFHFKWEKYPHRLSVLGSRFVPVMSEADRSGYFNHELSVKIGNWPPERALYTVPYQLVNDPSLYIGKGHLSIYTSCPIEEGTVSRHKVSLRPESLLQVNNSTIPTKDHQVAVLLNGFRIQSVNNVSGWHFGGLGIQISNAHMTTEGEIAFDVEVFARPARSPELITHGNKKWNYRKVCNYDFDIDIAVIAGAEDMMHAEKHSIVAADNSNRKTFFNQANSVLQGTAAKYQHAISGISGFNFKLTAHDNAWFKKRTGRYIREMGFYIDGFEYDQETGAGTIKSTTVFSNDPINLHYLAMKHKLESSLVLHMIQLNGVSSTLHQHVSGATSRQKSHSDVKAINGHKAS